MFNNIGGKIKAVAACFTWIGFIASILGGAYIILESELLLGLLVMLIGCFASWLSSLTLYGFGQLIENTDKLVARQKKF